MRILATPDLDIVGSDQPLPTVEVDLESLPEGEPFPSVLNEILSRQIEDSLVATIYTYFGPSVNFGTHTSSAFVLVAGRSSILSRIEQGFRKLSGTRVRFSDYVSPSQALPHAHLEEGTLWRPLDADNWYSDVEMLIPDDATIDDQLEFETDEIDLDSLFNESEIDAAVRKAVPLRTRAARSDASIGSITRSIERIFALPEGSVALCGPDKRALRRDAKIGTLRRRWE